MSGSHRVITLLALGALAACASAPTLSPSVAPLPAVAIASSEFATDSLDILQCAQRIGATAGYFPEGRSGTVLVRQPHRNVVGQTNAVPVRRPGTSVIEPVVTVRNQQTDSRQLRILIRPRTRWGWARANARATGGHGASTREVLQLMNSRCTLRRDAT